jgi:hypothetical protein
MAATIVSRHTEAGRSLRLDPQPAFGYFLAAGVTAMAIASARVASTWSPFEMRLNCRA